MGRASLKHPVKQGSPVPACDIDQKQIDVARGAGAAVAATPAELGKAVRFVIIGVGYDDEATAVMLGPNGLLASMSAGSGIAVSSTCAPRHLQRLPRGAPHKGAAALGAP